MGVFVDPAPAAESADIAVIGLACRFPGGASDSQKFWELLHNKRSAFGKAPDSRYNVAAFHHEAAEKLNTLSANGGHFLDEDVAAFDAPFFSITSQEATAMDPTARMLLEVTYEALENAGLPIENLVGSDTSCYVGCFTRDYHEMLMRDAETAPMYAGTGTGFSLLSNRISWFYDLRGPSMTLDTACSSSMVGLNLACQSLRSAESKIALVCGANLILSPDLGMWLSNLRMTSTDGLSRSFADGVTGYGRGEGIATLVLKPVRDALRDGDPIRAVIRGVGVNQDGHTTGITVPNRQAQADLIQSTYLSAGLDVSQTSYFEAHGTGTAVGDPLELGAVYQAISANRAADDPLYIGSVKSNIGHLEGAAGMAGVIKCILMLEKGSILPNIHFDYPNKRIPFEKWRLKVPTDVIPWPKHGLRRASVNSFGYGGTNAHAIIDSAEDFLTTINGTTLKDQLSVNHGDHTKLFVFTTASESALRLMMKRTSQFLSEEAYHSRPGGERTYLDQLAFTLSERRSQFPWKAVVMANSLTQLKQNLISDDSVLAHVPKKPRIAFVFTGQGAQCARMGVELWEYRVFRESVQAADTYLRSSLGSEWSVVAELEKDVAASQINLAQFSQPLCTVLQIALVELLRSWNVEPMGVVGHSSGEIAAAYCCGALTREDAWTVAYYRGRVCSELSHDVAHVKGAMMAVGLSAEAARESVRDVQAGTVVVACVNSPSSVTISGDAAGIDELQQTLAAKGVFCRKLQVEHAYHSHHMKRVANTYLEQIASLSAKKAPSDSPVVMVSSVTGNLISSDELGPSYWVQNFVSPVLFTDAVSTLLQNPTRRRRRARPGESAFDLLLEIGPHSALKGPLRQILQQQGISTVTYASVLQRGESAIQSVARAAAELYVRGTPVRICEVNRLNANLTPLVDLPSYPWDHSLRYWAESRLSRNYRLRRFGRHDLLGAPAADASEKQPRWRNILRVQEQPWLRDHVVQSSILFPGAGSLVMVLEAVQQLAAHRQIESIKLEQVRITKAILIPDDQAGIETVLQLHHKEEFSDSREDFWDFSIESCPDGLSLDQNVSGRVMVRYSTETGETLTTGKKLMWQTARDEYNSALQHCTQTVDPAAFYKATNDAGLQYGPLFQGLTEITAGSGRCVTVLKITDSKASMPGSFQSPHLIHPTTLDVIFHSMFTATESGNLDFENAAVPIAFDSLIFYMNLPSTTGNQLRSCCRVNRDEELDLVADIYVSDIAWEQPKIVVKGMRCRELPVGVTGRSSSGPPKAPVGTLVWKPDLAFLNQTSLREYMVENLQKRISVPDIGSSTSWESEPEIVVDLLAHKNPDLSILEIGQSNDLVDSLLPVLGSSRAKTLRCSSYTVLDPDADRVSLLREKFLLWSDTLSFNVLDVQGLGEDASWAKNLYDMIIVHAGVLAAEQVHHLKKYVRAGGVLLVQEKSTDWLESPFVNGHEDTNLTKNWPILHCSPTSNWSLVKKLEGSDFADQTVVLIEPAGADSTVVEISRQLSFELAAMGVRTETIRWPAEAVNVQGKTLVSLLDLQTAFLPDISSDNYAALKTLILNSTRFLWVAMGNDPTMQAAMGYLRVLQNENINLDLRYLLLEERDGRSPADIAQTLAPVVVSPTTDREYVELKGCLRINRWVDDDHLTGIMTNNEEQHGPELVRLGDMGTTLTLAQSSSKASKTATYAPINEPCALAADEIEVQVRATTINGHASTSIAQFSGIVSQIGTTCSRLKPGDPVWGCVAADGPRTFFNVKECLCQLLPKDSTFEDAASWPLTLGKAYAALVEAARVREGQTVLIQAAASAVGQFAVQLVQQLKAVALVLVNDEEQRRQMESLGVSAEHVLDENDPDLAIAITGLTHGQGVNVILHQSSTPKSLQRLWSCIAASGIFVSVDFDPVSNDELGGLGFSVASLSRGASYSLFDARKAIQENPSRLGGILRSVSQLQSKESLRQPGQRTIWRSSQAADAFEWACSHPQGTAVLSFDAEDKIPVTADVANPLTLEANVTYLLVGGTGGLGANLATFLAQRGARHLAVVSRSGPSSKNAASFTQQLASVGANVTLYAADVSDETAMRQVLDQCAAEMPPIRGVIQCAAVLDDSVYHNMTHDQWRNAIRPKIHGSWILHSLLPRNLQFFVMLSSIAGVVGNRGQANYAAGNTFQDALAHYRRGQGLPAVSVDLGLMLGIGLIAERGGATNLKKWEAVGIHEQEFHRLMTAALVGYWSSYRLPAQVICGLPTGGILHSEGLERPFYFDDSRFAYLKKKDIDPAKGLQHANDDQEESLVSQLGKAQSLREATNIITGSLKDRLARELQTNVENIDASRPLHSYGIDSLMAVEIRTWILAHLQAEMSLFDVLSGGSIYALATKITAVSRAVPDTMQE